MTLQQEFGNIDIYLFDQLLKGRILPDHKILDAGCGAGRNLVYFLQKGYQIFGIDQNSKAIAQVQHLAQQFGEIPGSNFRTCEIAEIPFQPGSFDWVICNAVLHFARNPHHFDEMLQSLWKQLKPGGILFARLASDIGIADKIKPLGEGRFFLPDGSERFLVSEESLLNLTQTLNGQLLEPIKTTNVQNLRAMTTWVVQKRFE